MLVFSLRATNMRDLPTTSQFLEGETEVDDDDDNDDGAYNANNNDDTTTRTKT